MLIVAPDFDRRIDLPGAGPCPRPVDIDRTRAPLERLVSLRVYSFARGSAIDGEAEGDEVFIVLMRGAADVSVRDATRAEHAVALRTDSGPRALYMPPHAAYHLRAVTACDIAYARCVPGEGAPPAVAAFEPDANGLRVIGHAQGMDLTLASIAAGGQSDGGEGSGSLPERFVHIRSDGGTVRAGDVRLADWCSAIVGAGEALAFTAAGADVEIMTVSATAR